MRLMIAAIVLLPMLGGCASYMNRPPQPEGKYWQVNKQIPATPAQPVKVEQPATEGNIHG